MVYILIQSESSHNLKNPIVIPGKDNLSPKDIISEVHLQHLHAGRVGSP